MGAQGTATVDFGAFPGSAHASVAITGQASILAGSLVEAWILPAATADHSSDEHLVEKIRVVAGDIIAGTGFTIHAVSTNELSEPLMPPGVGRKHVTNASAGQNTYSPGDTIGRSVGGKMPMVYGQWSVAWVWN